MLMTTSCDSSREEGGLEWKQGGWAGAQQWARCNAKWEMEKRAYFWTGQRWSEHVFGRNDLSRWEEGLDMGSGEDSELDPQEGAQGTAE